MMGKYNTKSNLCVQSMKDEMGRAACNLIDLLTIRENYHKCGFSHDQEVNCVIYCSNIDTERQINLTLFYFVHHLKIA